MSRVVLPEGEGSVYGSITLIDALLNGYAGASQQCQKQIQEELALVLGPADPTVEACTDSTGLTCELQRAHSEIRTSLEQLSASSDDAVIALDLDTTRRAVNSMGAVNADFMPLKSSVEAFDPAQSEEGIRGQVRNIRKDIRSLRDDLTRSEKTLDDIHRVAERGIARSDSLEVTRQRLEDEICAMVQPRSFGSEGDPTDTPSDAPTDAPVDPPTDDVPQTPSENITNEANGLTSAEARRLLNYLSNDGCSTPAGPSNWGKPDNLERQLTKNLDLWNQILAATTRVEESDPETGEVVRTYHQSVDDMSKTLDDFEVALTMIETIDHDGTFALDAFMDTLKSQLAAVEASTADLTRDVQGIFAAREKVKSDLEAVFAEAETKLTEDAANAFSDGYRRIGDTQQASQDLLSETFSDLIVGLIESGNSITTSARATIESTDAKVSTIATETATANTERVIDNLNQINTTTSSAARR